MENNGEALPMPSHHWQPQMLYVAHHFSKLACTGTKFVLAQRTPYPAPAPER